MTRPLVAFKQGDVVSYQDADGVRQPDAEVVFLTDDPPGFQGFHLGDVDNRIWVASADVVEVRERYDGQPVLPLPRRVLIVEYDVTGWTDAEIDDLTGEAYAIGESGEVHPSAAVAEPALALVPGGDVWVVDTLARVGLVERLDSPAG